MSLKEYVSRLSREDFIYVMIETAEGKTVNLTVVYFSEFDGFAEEIFRVDCAHGFLHKHLLFKPKERIEIIERELSGELDKELVDEIKANWKEMKKKYFLLKKRGELSGQKS